VRPGARVLAVAASLLCLALIVPAVAIGTAAGDARRAQDVLVALDAGRPVDAALREQAVGGARRAVEREPRNGAHHELVARLALHLARTAPRRAERQAALAQAAAAIARARERRPAWPYAAALDAVIADADDRHGPAFAAAVNAALATGPHEARVREMLASLWLRAPARAAAPALEAAFRAQLAREPTRWIDRADRSGAADPACRLAQDVAEARRRCIELGWTPGAVGSG
jgi:hypothetical protein